MLDEVTVRLIEPRQLKDFDQTIEKEHYLKNANAVGQVLRYVAEYQGQWIALLTFCSASRHLKPRDSYLHWSPREVPRRRHLIAQNSRFLILPTTGRWPNLASRILKLVSQRISGDWEDHFGRPILLLETFVDPQRFTGTCYKASGWTPLGQTKGYKRRGRDYYLDLKHPKELWVKPLGGRALKTLRAEELPAHLSDSKAAPPPPSPVPTALLSSLWEFLRDYVEDPRDAQGLRHPLGAVLCIATLAIACGCTHPHAIAEFASSLNHGQRNRLRCRRRKHQPRQYEVPCERTFRRLLAALDPDQLKEAFIGWMEQLDPQALQTLHMDGKVVRNAKAAPAKLKDDPDLEQAAASIDTPQAEQKPKADKALTLVNFQTPGQRLIDQIAVPSDTNEEAAVAAHLPKMDLTGVLVIGDAAHTVKANCQCLTQELGAEYLFFLKGNQPTALANAKRVLAGELSPKVEKADKGHGRVEERKFFCCDVDGARIGLAGAAQVFRLEQKTDYIRAGDVYRQTQSTRYGVVSLGSGAFSPRATAR